MKDGIRLKSKSGICPLLTALEERGFLTRHHDRARALEVLRLPHNLAVWNPSIRSARAASTNSGQSTISIGPSGCIANPRPANSGVIEVPLYGRIAAGLAVEAPHVSGDYVAVPAALLRDDVHQYYALEVVDDSMTGAGILEGDLVIIRRNTTAESGEISVAPVDGGTTPNGRRNGEAETDAALLRDSRGRRWRLVGD
jgi:repressor LexA